VFGRALVRQFDRAPQYALRLMSRQPQTPGDARHEWVQADLATGAGVATALRDVDIVIHAASQPTGQTHKVDVLGTQRLLHEACQAGISHVVYLSIVGIEHIPLPYYRAKLAAEALVQTSGLSWSIIRATQFHQLIAGLLQQAYTLPLMVLPTTFLFQPIDPGEVAAYLAQALTTRQGGRLPDIGGPEVLTLGELARMWLVSQQRSRRILHLPLIGRIAQAFKQGKNTCPDQRIGTTTWRHWLNGHKETT
jgi:uncharacterized protein YbjT (DUF2867 family)